MKFSVITVCLDNADTIKRTIESVISQKNIDIEYIIIDGGSKDGTVDIIKSFENKIAYWCSEPDHGIYDAMNKGIGQSSGDIISFLNSDDWYENNILQVIQNEFIHATCDVICGKIRYIKNGQIIGESSRVRNVKDIYMQMIYQHPAMFVKREIFEDYGLFDSNYKICADYDWTLRMYNNGIEFKEIDCICTNFSLGGASAKRECADETKNVSLKNLPQKFYQEYHDMILKTYFQNRIFSICSEVTLLLENGTLDMEKCRRILQVYDIGSECNLFGMGRRGCDCLYFLKALNIKVRNIYDSNESKQGMKIDNVVVKAKRELEDSLPIIITSAKYEMEIEEEFAKLDLHNFVRFSDIAREIAEAYEKELSEQGINA